VQSIPTTRIVKIHPPSYTVGSAATASVHTKHRCGGIKTAGLPNVGGDAARPDLGSKLRSSLRMAQRCEAPVHRATFIA